MLFLLETCIKALGTLNTSGKSPVTISSPVPLDVELMRPGPAGWSSVPWGKRTRGVVLLAHQQERQESFMQPLDRL